jgi:hypothetical protein
VVVTSAGRRALRRGLPVRVQCSSACRAELRLTYGRRVVAPGVVVVSSRAGTRSLRLRFSRDGARRLQRLRHPRLTLHAVVRAEEGDVRTLKRAVRLF